MKFDMRLQLYNNYITIILCNYIHKTLECNTQKVKNMLRNWVFFKTEDLKI